jgi:hypothetical protein
MAGEASARRCPKEERRKKKEKEGENEEGYDAHFILFINREKFFLLNGSSKQFQLYQKSRFSS